jgi:hypothetical protein
MRKSVMKKKKIIKQLEKENAKLRLTRYELIQDIRVLLGKDDIQKSMVSMKYDLLDGLDRINWQGDSSITMSKGFLDLIEEPYNKEL